MTCLTHCACRHRVKAAVCFFATDIHTATLGRGGSDSLRKFKAGALSASDKAELLEE